MFKRTAYLVAAVYSGLESSKVNDTAKTLEDHLAKWCLNQEQVDDFRFLYDDSENAEQTATFLASAAHTPAEHVFFTSPLLPRNSNLREVLRTLDGIVVLVGSTSLIEAWAKAATISTPLKLQEPLFISVGVNRRNIRSIAAAEF